MVNSIPFLTQDILLFMSSEKNRKSDNKKLSIIFRFRKFPKFDLSKIHDHDSNVIKKLRGSPHLRKSFVNKFSAVFKSYLEWKKYNAEVEES